MKRKVLCVAAAVGAAWSLVALVPRAPVRTEALVQACVTITPKFVGAEVNGIPIGVGTDGQPRTCIVV